MGAHRYRLTVPSVRHIVRRAAERLHLTLLVEPDGTFTGVEATPEEWARVWLEVEVDALVDEDLRARDPARALLLGQLRQRRYSGKLPVVPETRRPATSAPPRVSPHGGAS